MEKLNVLVVDDSLIYRKILTDAINKTSNAKTNNFASNVFNAL